MYICVKFSPRDLNPGPYPPHPTNTYTCGVTIVPRVCNGVKLLNWKGNKRYGFN